ncbi:hypothetical protein [Sulfurimonas sp.]|uniref:hypothetical protein n=1 Tax=Sulfurimonas sp. TaxID=2022749 RepID=UPI0026161E22|nr:hypothetical protein [Sulfurimonas sp.]
MKRIKNIANIFHLLIIAGFFLGFSGCGYKAAPYYKEEKGFSDKNVKFIIQKKELQKDNNASCSQ